MATLITNLSVLAGLGAALLLLLTYTYLVRLNIILQSTPEAIQKVSPKRWTKEELRQTYQRLEKNPITLKDYADRIPPKLDRRYIITGGSGLVGGYIVLQLLERGQPPESIRIVEFRPLNRTDMLNGPASTVDFVKTDISSAESTDKAFEKPWPSSVANRPLTVFHTAAVIVPSDRSKLVYGLCESVNVRGTQNVLNAARKAGADVLVSTSSGGVSIRPIELWISPWKLLTSTKESMPEMKNYLQVMDEKDFFEPPRKHEEHFANYAVSKAAAERIVCGANSPELRTGSIRPANGVYGQPGDNTLGGALAMGGVPDLMLICYSWCAHIIQPFVHGINVAIVHLYFEAILASNPNAPQAGRPFIITDPNPPISYLDMYYAIETLSITPFRLIRLPPITMWFLSYIVEWYSLLPVKYPLLRNILPELKGDLKHMKPGLFSVTTHMVATNENASRAVDEGGLGYTGFLTTLEGMAQEILDWNKEHKDEKQARKYQTSISFADEIAKAAEAAGVMEKLGK
ncbi:hypothetical protein B0T21DRAFT_295389 [Apiosordaria backusii]|uniref:3-beta hydroxysteroid dehydrogenase/isomerase domain-containing protein n=1 Tax=Apiosordaria backusii TaxID=314023 RepID=A0AA40AN89_9PEZI|nr:hypothetical protein B0T21DRAFT_295389 [Apiosordaria backusii]